MKLQWVFFLLAINPSLAARKRLRGVNSELMHSDLHHESSSVGPEIVFKEDAKTDAKKKSKKESSTSTSKKDKKEKDSREKASPCAQDGSTCSPTPSPTISSVPSMLPSDFPSSEPTISFEPSVSMAPSAEPSMSSNPSSSPTMQPSSSPSKAPTNMPSDTPTISLLPSEGPTMMPSAQPSGTPSSPPTSQPTASPSSNPTTSASPTASPQPSYQPSPTPTQLPSASMVPSLDPDGFDTAQAAREGGTTVIESTCRKPLPDDAVEITMQQIDLEYLIEIDADANVAAAVDGIQLALQREAAKALLDCDFDNSNADFLMNSIDSISSGQAADKTTCFRNGGASSTTPTSCVPIRTSMMAEIFKRSASRRELQQLTIENEAIFNKFKSFFDKVFNDGRLIGGPVRNVAFVAITNTQAPTASPAPSLAPTGTPTFAPSVRLFIGGDDDDLSTASAQKGFDDDRTDKRRNLMKIMLFALLMILMLVGLLVLLQLWRYSEVARKGKFRKHKKLEPDESDSEYTGFDEDEVSTNPRSSDGEADQHDARAFDVNWQNMEASSKNQEKNTVDRHGMRAVKSEGRPNERTNVDQEGSSRGARAIIARALSILQMSERTSRAIRNDQKTKDLTQQDMRAEAQEVQPDPPISASSRPSRPSKRSVSFASSLREDNFNSKSIVADLAKEENQVDSRRRYISPPSMEDGYAMVHVTSGTDEDLSLNTELRRVVRSYKENTMTPEVEDDSQPPIFVSARDMILNQSCYPTGEPTSLCDSKMTLRDIAQSSAVFEKDSEI